MKMSLIAAAAALSLSMISFGAFAQVANADSLSAVGGSTFANSGSIPGGTWSSSSLASNTTGAISTSTSGLLGGASSSTTFSTGGTYTSSGLAEPAGNGGAGATAFQEGVGTGDATSGTLSIIDPPFGTAQTTSGSQVGTGSQATTAGFTGDASSGTLANATNVSNATIGFLSLSGTASSVGGTSLSANSTTSGVGNSAIAGGTLTGGVGGVSQGSASVAP